ncbi:MAG: lysophospholipid acyltransferase family protein [Terracidiphilus sp.]
MTLRRLRRAVALVFALVLCIFRMWLLRLRGPLTLERQAEWSQWSSRLVLKALGVHYQVEGQPPTHGLVVCNHLSYIDILVIAAAMPCFFVAKMEIRGWPFFGMAARSNGTIFVDRGSLASAMTVAEQMTERLKLPIQVPVLLFPEGTSTDGSQVIRFHSRLIDPATSIGAPISTAAIGYLIEGGVDERELCWYGDESFATHLWKVLGTAGFSAHLRFGQPRVYTDRRVAADETRAEIEAMRAGGVLALQ